MTAISLSETTADFLQYIEVSNAYPCLVKVMDNFRCVPLFNAAD